VGCYLQTTKDQNTVKDISDYADEICALPHISSDTCNAYKDLNQVGSKVRGNHHAFFHCACLHTHFCVLQSMNLSLVIIDYSDSKRVFSMERVPQVYTNVFIVIYITWGTFFMTLGMIVSQFMACFYRHHILLFMVCIRMVKCIFMIPNLFE
jgi:hypothetical protein